MLQGKDDSPRRTLSRSAAVFLFVVLTGGAVAISALRGSDEQPATNRTQGKEANTGSTVVPSAGNSRIAPFDLSYVDLTLDNVIGVGAIRPAEFFHRPGVSVLVDPINTVFQLLMKEYSLSGDPVLRLDAIEQIIGEVTLTHDGKAPKGHQNGLILDPHLIRMEKDFDWKERMRTVVPKAEKIHYRGKTYYKGQTKLFPGVDMCYFIPDARTVVFRSEKTIRRVIDGQKGGADFAASADWQRVEQGLLAVWLDMRRAREISGEVEPNLAPLFEKTEKLVFAVDHHDTLTMSAFANCADNKAAETLVRWTKSHIKSHMAEGIASLDENRGMMADSMLFSYRLCLTLLKHTRVEQHDSKATLRTEAAIDFAELAKMPMPLK